MWLLTRFPNKRRMLSMASSFPLESHIHPACFLPLGLPLGMNRRGEGTLCLSLSFSQLFPLSPSPALPPSLATCSFSSFFITFSFLPPPLSLHHLWSSYNAGLSELLSFLSFLFVASLQSLLLGVTRAHDSQKK